MRGGEVGRGSFNWKYFIADFTNKGFEHSVERLVPYVGEVDQDQVQDQVVEHRDNFSDLIAGDLKMKNGGLAQRIMDEDKTLVEFNNSKESTMI